ncbi:hypothetical protein [Streptomyces sp. 35G-GA-8]|uniref:hypothetical protein n=1 Tax=Streptomyces sp. 35G-GA-8 TaxID=2939434 RepID=UPI00201EB09B|nr:hypothetical protein [Streptomyces sp. 35G-GA-8]MCL7377495.1 hypothetical protein [Streptomyces sp. 35G-GA-8]
MTRYFYVITIDTGAGMVSVDSTLHASEVTTRQQRYKAAYADACKKIRASKIDIPDGAPTLFYTCEPDE